jgi:hypothetical protein
MQAQTVHISNAEHSTAKPHLSCRTAVLHSASFMARLRSISRMTMDASCASSVQLSALKSLGFTSRMHLQQQQYRSKRNTIA